METKTKPYLLLKGEKGPLLEQYLTNICNLYNISNELHDTIQFSVNEIVSILFSLKGEFAVEKIRIQYNKTSAGLWFELKGVIESQAEDVDEELLDREIRRIKMEQELFVVGKLSDEMIIDPLAMSISIFFACEDIGFARTMTRINNLQNYWAQWEKIKI